jgi:transposase
VTLNSDTNPDKGNLTIGLDLGDRFSHFVALDADGAVSEEGRLRTTPDGLRGRFGTMPRTRIAIEAGAYSHWVSRLLTELGHEVLVANPRKLRLIYENESKNDRVDATYLARVARLDPSLLKPIRHRGPQAQADLAILRAREVLVRTRTRLVNHVRSSVKVFGDRLPSCSAGAFPKKAQALIPESLRPALEPLLETIQQLTRQILQYDRKIEQVAKQRYPDTERLSQVPGVGSLTSMGYVLTLEDPTRFKESRAVGSYLGLRPRQKDSGSREPQLRITKAGDEFVRRLLVGCAHYILGPFGPDSDLRRWGLALAKRGGKNAKKRAVVAVARKLAVILHCLWVSGERYEPLRNSTRPQQVVKDVPA